VSIVQHTRPPEGETKERLAYISDLIMVP